MIKLNRLTIKINGTIVGYQKGQEVSVSADENGTPYDQFWRRRLKDAEIDNCCEIVMPRAATRSKTIKRESK